MIETAEDNMKNKETRKQRDERMQNKRRTRVLKNGTVVTDIPNSEIFQLGRSVVRLVQSTESKSV
jgi:hypothetical protein